MFVAAAKTSQEVPGAHAEIIVQKLLADGVSRVGKLDLLQFQKEIEDVRWEVTHDEIPIEVVGLRRSGYYSVVEKKVTVTHAATKEPAENLELLELHEALGALGYRDGNYSQSMALNILNKVKDPSLRKILLNSYGDSIFSEKNLKIAGGSSVGGGGDSESLMLKNQIFDSIFNGEASLLPDFFVEFPEVNFEPWEDIETQHVWAQYSVKNKKSNLIVPGARQDQNFYEVLTFFYPAMLWKNEPVLGKILSEIKEILLAIYPAVNLGGLIEIRPKGCPAIASFLYPKTEDPSTLLIQNARTRIHFGCENFENEMTYVTSPRWIRNIGQAQ